MNKIEDKNFTINHSSLVIDGGNIVVGEIELPNTYTTNSFIVMTDKVMRENEQIFTTCSCWQSRPYILL